MNTTPLTGILPCSRRSALLAAATFAAFPMWSRAEEETPEMQELQKLRDALILRAGRQPLSTKEQFGLSAALFGCGNFEKSLITAQVGVGSSHVPMEQSAFHILIAMNHGALGQNEEAAHAALRGQRLNPESKELALLRYAHFQEIRDLAQTESAKDTLQHLDPDGEPVFAILGVMAVYHRVRKIYSAYVAIVEIARENWPRVKPHVEMAAKAAMEIYLLIKQHAKPTTAPPDPVPITELLNSFLDDK